jgi:hypothetical protein
MSYEVVIERGDERISENFADLPEALARAKHLAEGETATVYNRYPFGKVWPEPATGDQDSGKRSVDLEYLGRSATISNPGVPYESAEVLQHPLEDHQNEGEPAEKLPPITAGVGKPAGE